MNVSVSTTRRNSIWIVCMVSLCCIAIMACNDQQSRHDCLEIETIIASNEARLWLDDKTDSLVMLYNALVLCDSLNIRANRNLYRALAASSKDKEALQIVEKLERNKMAMIGDTVIHVTLLHRMQDTVALTKYLRQCILMMADINKHAALNRSSGWRQSAIVIYRFAAEEYLHPDEVASVEWIIELPEVGHKIDGQEFGVFSLETITDIALGTDSELHD